MCLAIRPNEDNPKFFKDCFLTMSTLRGSYIIGVDFNSDLNLAEERSTGCDTSKIQARKSLKQYIVDLNLVEVWREKNPDKREYSCHSSACKSHSCIDYFLISRELLSKI